MVGELTFTQYLDSYEINRTQYVLGLLGFEARRLYIPQKFKTVSFSAENRIYNQTNITPFTIPIYYLN